MVKRLPLDPEHQHVYTPTVANLAIESKLRKAVFDLLRFVGQFRHKEKRYETS